MQVSQKKKTILFSFRVADGNFVQQQDSSEFVNVVTPLQKSVNQFDKIQQADRGGVKSIESYIYDIFCISQRKRQSQSLQLVQKKDFSSKNIDSQKLILQSVNSLMRLNYSQSINRKYQQGQIQIDDQFLKIAKFDIPFKNIFKAKIMPLQASSKQISQRILKFQISSEVQQSPTTLFLSVNAENKGKIPQHFQLFADIVLGKLLAQGVKQKQSKWKKTPHIIPQVNINSYIFGKIYKKSQLRSKWNQRYVVVKQNGIYSYRENSDKNPSFYIPADSIKYIWTRFELVYEFLIIKIKHGLSQTEFGIPIFQYNKDGCNNWLYQFYRIVNRKL